jgi:hypothetical protein
MSGEIAWYFDQAGIEFLVMDHQQAEFSKSDCLDIEEELKC